MNVSQEQIVQAMEEFATFKRNEYVQLGRIGRSRIQARKWSFERGTFFYLVKAHGKAADGPSRRMNCRRRCLEKPKGRIRLSPTKGRP